MADSQTSTNLLTHNKTIKLGFRTQPLVTESPENRFQSLNLLQIRKAKVNRFNINLSMDTDELESLERDRLLGLDTKFNQRTQEKQFIKINDILTNPTDFTEVDFRFMGDQSSDQKVLNLAKVLSRHHSLKRAALDFLWCQNLTQNGIKNFVKTLFKLNRLNQFSLAYKNFYQSEKAAKDISLMTRTFTRYFTQTQVQLSLQDNNISYHFKGVENTDMPGVAFGYIKSPMSTDDPVKLLETIKKLSHSINGIVSIKLDFQGWNELANTHLIALKELLSKFCGLTSFELNLTKCNGITDIGMFMIKNILANQPNLKHLKLGLSNIHITDNGVSAISDAVSKLTNLKSLDIDFSGVKNISKVSILGETLTRLRLLEVLAFQFEGCDKITDDDIKQINFPHDKLHENLNTIVLNFKGCREITNEGVKDFSIGISSLRNLQHLALRLNRCPKITDDGLKQLAFTMSQNFHSLKGISLSFSTCQKITDQGISYLASEIGESNLNLEQIDLQFTLCHELTYKGLETTLTNLSKQLKKLKKLSLDFSSCAKITDEALKELKSDLEFYFEALQELTLCLSSKQVSEKGLNSLMTLFKNLNHLSLQLRRSQLLTDEGVKRLGSHIMMQFDKLKKLDLDFESCELISDDGIKQLVSDFASRLKNLESLSLNLSKCNQVTKEVKGHVRRTLSFLPNINL